MKHRSTTSLRSRISSQLSVQQQVKAIQSDQRRKHQQAIHLFWNVQGILFIDYLEKGRTIYSRYYIALEVRLMEEIAKKTAKNEEVKSALSPRQCTVSQVDRNDGKIKICSPNCFRTRPILQICPLATTDCLQITKEYSRERDLAPIKK